MRQIVEDVGMVRIQSTARRVVAVTFLRYRQTDDATRGIGQTGDEARGIFGCDNSGTNAAQNTGDGRGAVTLECGVEAVLRGKPVTLVRPFQADAGDAPGAGLDGEQVIRVGGEMGANEGSQAEMDDAGLERSAVVVRHYGAEQSSADRGVR